MFAPKTRPVAPAPVPVVTPPVLQPLVTLPSVELPDAVEEIVQMASVLEGLQQLEEQDLTVRAAYPVCWGMIWTAGLDETRLKTLMPLDVFPDQTPDPAVVIPQRTLGALRRALDKLAAKWEVKHAEIALKAEVTAGAATFKATVMNEAKRVQRKRLPSTDLSKNDATAATDSTAEL